jgi:asparagine synthase (glutamine-hydrolysing)
MFADPEHQQRLWEDFDTCGGVPFEQDWIAIKALKSGGWISDDALIVNGQSGDFITGNHIPKTLFENVPNDEATRRQRIHESIFSKHYSLWSALLTPNNKERIAKLLADESDAGGASLLNPNAPHGVYEFLEYQDRQAKYVISGQRTYEALGYGWRLPLWDDEYVLFWRRVPVEYKARQSLYRKTLLADDWGGVWQDVPVNAKTIRPRWIVPLRIAAKLAFAPLGADRWHRAERRLLQWWMDPMRLSAVVPYSKAVRDNRGARHALAWLTDRYLMQHGVDINALFE